ncbi:DUF4344 domain-containing metallopeptidase [uncultured Roseibium sp.]|uniref:DUF4344 domain-containing metallopeptidase n=1 Tax=uncultured Roseibium sp. TaxID=1936171 RepID=UPI002633EE75|nr:DUF4344 domain-containing metallopeptidase [uncultured Roseibium sp.]
MAPIFKILVAVTAFLALAIGPMPYTVPAEAQDGAPAYPGLEDSLQDLEPDIREELLEFVAGNTLFVIYHEGGHMLVSELELPVLAQEEDAVDNLATISMLSADTDNMDLYLYHAMTGWFLMSEEDYDALVFYDSHDLDQQRGYRMLCMMVGADEDAFLDLAEELALPEDRIENCAIDYEQAADSWEYVTDPFVRDQDTPAGKISIVYGDAPDELRTLAASLQENALLEMVAEELDTFYDLPENVTFRASECQEDNAFWDPNEREVILCYELLGGFAELYLELLAEEE